MSQPKTLCLNMIVKNEMANLERCLGSVADHIGCWVICDTGSTDGTQDFIRSFFAARNIPGELHSFPFVNFEQARNEALDRAYASSLAYDYLLFDDADMELVVEDPGFRAKLDAPAYMLTQRAASGLAYWNMRLARRDAGMRYHGVTHEHLDVPHGTQRLEGVWYKDHASGANRVDKFERDIRLLSDALQQDPNNSRYWFYLAQSYRDAGRTAEAVEAYAKRAGMGGWDEEAWNARLNEARCLRTLGDEGGFVRAALAAFNQRPHRAEPLYDLARYYRERGMNDASVLFCEAGIGLPRPQHDILFVEEFAYTAGLWEEYSIAANYSRDPSRKERGHAACNWLALSRDVPEGTRNLARSNLYYYAQSANVMLPSFTARTVGFAAPDGFNPLNPSIARQGEQIVMIQRTGNWAVTDEGQYWVPGGGPVRTRNFLLHLNPHLDTESSVEIFAPADWPEPLCGHVLGFEDPRLFTWRDELWCSSTVKELNPAGWCQQVLARIDCQEPGLCRLTDWRVLGPGGELAWHEKNWMPQVVSDDLNFIYLCDPTRIVDESGHRTAEAPAAIAAEQFRGGSQAVAFDGGWLVLIHEVIFHGGSRRSYYHRFVWFDAANVLRRVSRRFFFHRQGIEFAAGLAWHPDNKRLLISYGVGDKEAWIATVGANDVRRILEDTGSLLSAATPRPIIPDYSVLPTAHPAGSGKNDRGQIKGETDVKLLRETLEREPENARCWFDLATSYFDAGQTKEAAEAYAKCAGMGGWGDEEAWYARLQEARCLRTLGDEGGFLRTALAAFNQRPQRAEPLYDLARFYRELGMNDASIVFCEPGLAIRWPSEDTLFLDDFIYTTGLREEYSIVANYARDKARKDRGHAACEWLALSRQVPEHSRNLARGNLVFYAHPLGELVPSFAAHHIAFDPPLGWSATNPGLARWDNETCCVIRCVNYTRNEDGSFTLPSGEPFRTRDYLARLDGNLILMSINEISMPADWPVPLSPHAQGFEDCRPFVWRDRLWVSATINELTPEGWCEIALARIEQSVSGPRFADWRILVPGGPKRNEKNWMPWVDNQTLRFVYLIDPGRIIDENAQTVHEPVSIFSLDHLRGGPPLLAFNGGWLTITHEVATFYGSVRRYLHRWVWFDSDGTVRRVSRAFFLLKLDVEFVVGLIWHPDGDRLIVSFGVGDREAWIATVDAGEVQSALQGTEALPWSTPEKATPDDKYRTTQHGALAHTSQPQHSDDLTAESSTPTGQIDPPESPISTFLDIKRSTTELLPNSYYLISHHNTIVYLDVALQCLCHAPFGVASLNLILESAGTQGRLVTVGNCSSEIHQVALAPNGEIREQASRGEFDNHIENFIDESIGIRIGEHYLSADSDGLIRNNRSWCREWERFHLVRADTLNGIVLLRRYFWLSHDDRRIMSLASESADFERERPGTFRALTPVPAEAIDLRQELVFGPARLQVIGKAKSLLLDGGGRYPPEQLHVVTAAGTYHSFSRFRPLIYYCVYGHDSHYECLRLSLVSLSTHGRYSGTIGVACDRPADEIMQFIPEPFRDRLIVSTASKDRGWFNQYYLDHGLYDDYQPIIYTDTDVVFDCDIINLLIDILLQRQVCCATEAHGYPDLADQSPRVWPEQPGDYFGRYLYAAEPEFPEKAALGNAGVVGFDSTARVHTMNELVKAIASRQTPERLKFIGDQSILNYVLHKMRLGNFEVMNRYCRLTRKIEDVPPAERRGFVHFHLASGAGDVSVKASAMASYLDLLERYEAASKDDRANVQLNLAIAGQMTAAELERLARLARLVPPNGCIVEIGSLFGLSSWTLARNAHPTVTVYCIDPWVREPWMAQVEASAGQTLSLETFRKNVASAHNIIPLPGYSPRDFIGWQRTVDLIFEDSVHANPTLHATLTFWSRFVCPGGVVCGHDYCDQFPDVKAEADKLATSLDTKVEVVGTLWSVALRPIPR